MSKERGQRNRDLFLGWVAEMKSKELPNWLDYWHGDTLSPKKIAETTNNPKIVTPLLLEEGLPDCKLEAPVSPASATVSF